MNPEKKSSSSHLVRSLGFREALALVIGTVIGTGVFLKTAVMSQQVGSPVWVLAAWAVAGLLSFMGALCYAELGGMFPSAGGEYIFLREAYGNFFGFLFGWMRFWIGTPGSIAAFAVGAATFMGAIVQFESETSRKLMGISLIVVFTGLNCFTVLVGGRVQSFLTNLKVIMIVGLAALIFFGTGNGSFAHFTPVSDGGFRGFSAFGTAMLAALWAYDGWNNMPMAAGEIHEPGRNIPRALGFGMFAVFLIYALANLAYFYALPFADILTSYSPSYREALPVATRAAQMTLGSTAVAVLSVAFVVSALGAMNGCMLTGARIPFAMARDRLFFSQLGELGTRTGTPAAAVVVQGLIASALAATGSFDELTNYVVFAAWIFYALGTGAVLVLRWRDPGAPRPFRVPGYPYLPAIFCLASVFLLGNTLFTATRESAIGLAFIVSGIPVYHWFRKSKTVLAVVLFALIGAREADAATAVNWAQPPVACVEHVVPSLPDRPCLNLESVVQPMKDFPPGLPPEEETYWRQHRPQLMFCRGQEVLRRERLRPGSQSAGDVETAWMYQLAMKNYEEKVGAVYRASRKHHIPAQVLAGALFQESLFSELGIAEDGGNYSCGISQVNVVEWCHWAVSDGHRRARQGGWPGALDDCALLQPSLLRPFYEIAKKRLDGEPEYRLQKKHFAGIRLADVISEFPTSSEAVQKRRFALIQSFIGNCSNASDGIAAKAHELAILYRDFIPSGIKSRERYPAGQKYQRQCRDRGEESYYPLHTGWLLAVGIYNAGPRALSSFAYYNRWGRAELGRAETFKRLTPVSLVHDLYWAGHYNRVTDKIAFKDLDGEETSWIWFKPCVLQRHIARVVQHVTLGSAPRLVESLEGEHRCARSVFDPATGALVRSAVPEDRQKSPGRRVSGQNFDDPVDRTIPPLEP